MPTYTTTTSSGKQIKFSSATPLDDAALAAIIAELNPSATPPLVANAPVRKSPIAGSDTQNAAVDPGYDEGGSGLAMQAFQTVLNTVPKAIYQVGQDVVRGVRGQEQVPLQEQLSRVFSPSSKLSSETVLEEIGMAPGNLRTGLAFMADMATPNLPVGKALKVLKMIPGVSKAATGIKALASTPAVKSVRDLVVQYPGLDKFVGASGLSAQDLFRLHGAKMEGLHNEAKERFAAIFKGMSPADAKTVAYHVDNPVLHPLPLGNNKLATAAAQFKQAMTDQIVAEQAAGLPTKLRPNYFTYIVPGQKKFTRQVLETPNVKGATSFSKAREKYKTLADVEAAGGLTNAAEVGVLRQASGQRAIANVELTHAMVAEFGAGAPTPAQIRAGYRKLDLDKLVLPETMSASLAGVHLPSAIADELENTKLFYRDRNALVTGLKGITRLYKTVQTSLNPAYYFNNAQGNVTGQVLGGMTAANALKETAREFPRVQSLIRNFASAPAIRREVIPNALNNLTVGEAFDTARMYNLFGGSEAAADYANALTGTQGMMSRSLNKVRAEGARVIEDPARWTLYIDQLKKGKTPEQAVIHVKNFLFDYSELTDFEKGVRDFGLVPYYSWKRKILPALLSGTINYPKQLRKIQLGYAAAGKFAGDSTPLAIPDWAREEGYVAQPSFMQSDPEGNTDLMRLANPALDLNELTSIKDLVGSNLGPLPKAAYELVSGRDLRTGRPLFDTATGQVDASPIGTLLANIYHGGIAGSDPSAYLPTLGTTPTVAQDGSIKFVQPPMAAFATRHLPIPFIPYAQQFSSDASKFEEPTTGRIAKNVALRALGLTPRSLTAEQELDAYEAPAVRQLQADKVDAQGWIRRGISDALRGTRPNPAPAPDAQSGLPEGLLERVIKAESFDPKMGQVNPLALSKSGARGLMQVRPTTAIDPGLGVPNIFEMAQQMGISAPTRGTEQQQADVLLRNPDLNVAFGSYYLTALLDRYNGDVTRALVGYNWGPGHADKWDGSPDTLPNETFNYITGILK